MLDAQCSMFDLVNTNIQHRTLNIESCTVSIHSLHHASTGPAYCSERPAQPPPQPADAGEHGRLTRAAGADRGDVSELFLRSARLALRSQAPHLPASRVAHAVAAREPPG